MKKSFLKKFKGASLLTKEETKTISGGYGNGSFTGTSCSYIICPANAYNPVINTCYNSASFRYRKEVYVNGSFQQYCFGN
jgi:hypothetical protein